MQSLGRRTKIPGPVVLVLPAHLTLTKFLRIPRVGRSQHDKIVGFEAAQNIPYALADVVWDSAVAGETASDRDVLLAAARLDILNPLCESAAKAGFRPRTVLPAPLATLAGFKWAVRPGKESGFLGINAGHRSTTFALIESHRFALRTTSLSPGKTPGGGAGEESFAARVAQEVRRSLLHFQSRSGMEKHPRTYLSGDQVRIPGFGETLVAKIKTPVLDADLPGAVEFSNQQTRQAVVGYEGTLIDLIGAAATQLFPGNASVNLLPSCARESEIRHKRRPWLAAAAVLAVSTLVPPIVHFETLGREARRKADVMEVELSAWRARDARIRAHLEQLREIRESRAVIENAYNRRTKWLELFAALQERLRTVEDVWLEKVQIMPPQNAETLKLSVSGRMLDRAHPLEKTSAEIFARVRNLLATLADESVASAIETERFDNHQPGILGFDFVLVIRAPNRL